MTEVVMSVMRRRCVEGTSRFSRNLSVLLGCQVFFDRLAHSSASACTGYAKAGDSIAPPVAVKRPFKRSKHGNTWSDPYHWIRINRDEGIAYLKGENAYADKCMSDTLHLQRKLQEEMASRLKEDISSPPERIGAWLYYTRIPKGQDYPVYCRKRHSTRNTTVHTTWRKLTASVMGWDDREEEDVLLDQNALVRQFGYIQLGTCRLSEDHNVMAYTLDTSGDEVFTLFIKDLRTGLVMTEEQKLGVVSVEWARDGRTLYYTEVDELLRPWRLYRRSLGSNVDDALIFEEKDASNFLDVSRTKDWSFITVNANSKTSSEVYLIDAQDPGGDLQLVEKRTPGLQYFVEHHQGFLYILTNSKFKGDTVLGSVSDYRLVRCPLGQMSIYHWQVICNHLTRIQSRFGLDFEPFPDISTLIRSLYLQLQEVVNLEPGAFIEDMEIFQKHLVLYQRSGGLPCVQVLDLPLTGFDSRRMLSLPQGVCTVVPGANEDFYSSAFRLSLSSPNVPEIVLEYDLATGKAEVLQQEEVLGVHIAQQKTKGLRRLGGGKITGTTERELASSERDSDAEEMDGVQIGLFSQYICQRHDVLSADGVLVPLTIVHGYKILQDGQNPALLIGYGAYGKSLEVEWCSDHLSLLDRGWVIAFSHVRGGGELGKSWHRAGRLLDKKNSFYDFVASANYLLDNKFAHRSKLGAMGISAGGLLVASAVNLDPSLFQAVILQVPFLDISNTLLDKDLPLSVHEYEEWGDPDDPKDFANIRSYSPYDNVQAGKSYPAMLVRTGVLDTRVGYWEAAKWVAMIRDRTEQDGSKVTILKSSMDSGHVADCGRFSHIRDTAYDYAFLIKMISKQTSSM